MRARSRWLPVLTCIPLLFILGATAVAAEGETPNPVETTTGTLFRWLNFAVVFGGLGYVIARFGPAFFGGRARLIAAAITEAEAARVEALRRLDEVEGRLRRLDQEIAKHRAAAQRETAAEAQRIRALTQQEIEKIGRAAQAEIEAAGRASRLELKALAARTAVETAAALLRTQMTPVAQAVLFRGFLDELARSAN